MDTKILNTVIATSLLLTTACGGGGGSTTPPQTNRVTVDTDAEWVACQDGKNGMWQARQRTTSTGHWQFECTVNDPEGRFGVAAAMTNFTLYDVKILQGTLNETHKASLIFDESFTPVDLTIEISNSTGTEQRIYFDEAKYIYNSDGSYSEKAASGTWDVVAIQADSQGDIVGDIILKRAVHITQGGILSIDYSESGIPNSALFEKNLSVTGHTGGNTNAEAFLSTAGHTIVHTGDSTLGKWSGLNSGLSGGDRYLFIANEFISRTGFDQSYFWLNNYNSQSNPGDISIDLSNRPLIEATSISVSNVEWPAYQPVQDSPPLRAYTIDMYQSMIAKSIDWEITISKGWLGDSNTHAYTIPDASRLEFPLDYDFGSGDINSGLTAVMFNVDPQTMAVLQAPIYWLPDLHFETTTWAKTFTN